ncbi:hypothetical protein CKAH01_03193 [Colletotrichum kahawae]|uniref:Uncharacterized protein n=1 Tax=Colletotrichum kahawae TaxID=34407 RepID=A0AAD9YT15_COLKA|nr:hypothetical protein CKAH01_03193 [Colletotrichum kahawae]
MVSWTGLDWIGFAASPLNKDGGLRLQSGARDAKGERRIRIKDSVVRPPNDQRANIRVAATSKKNIAHLKQRLPSSPASPPQDLSAPVNSTDTLGSGPSQVHP